MSLFDATNAARRRRELHRQELQRRQFERRLEAALARTLVSWTRAMSRGVTTERIHGLASAVHRILRRFARSVVLDVFRDAEENAPKASRQTRVDAFIASYDEWLLQRSTSISTTTAERVQEALRVAAAEGFGEREAARQAASVAAPMARRQAQTIARTEVHSMQQQSALSFASGVDEEIPLEKVWVATEDERSRPTHRDADGQRRPLNEPFQVGDAQLMVPGDPAGPPGEVINCRCVATYEPAQRRRSA